ncbi:c-type cytochrome [Methylorubrum thiocyanatum]|uniref:Cytochrome c553 n=1 Tax=Methylorubrum thiocyanatum TaxID=47958 RepID=A0AA40S479_9HYPH|nr:c-type cytochrome [Methylorubrum thiocyanatum]MBA8914118.1 cytochrome c553 [Methylorubrum thiocyanatum]
MDTVQSPAHSRVMMQSEATDLSARNRPQRAVRAGRLIAVRSLLCVFAIQAAGPVRADDKAASLGPTIAMQGSSRDRPACAACHGVDGAGQPDVGIPRLAGLHASYIADQLGYFASGKRRNPIMAPYAEALTPDQRRAVADYFAGLPIPSHVDAVPAPPAQLERGRALFQRGDAQTKLIACTQCHGPNGVGVGSFTPRLAGQSGPYISDQLHRWRDGDPRDPRGSYMQAIAARLSPEDIEAVATYAASLDPKPGRSQRSADR